MFMNRQSTFILPAYDSDQSHKISYRIQICKKKMAFGIGRAGSAPSEGVIYEKLKNLERKSYIRVLASERTGTRSELIAPSEIDGLITLPESGHIIVTRGCRFFRRRNQS